MKRDHPEFCISNVKIKDNGKPGLASPAVSAGGLEGVIVSRLDSDNIPRTIPEYGYSPC